ncbi:hypothetical protein BHE74_00017990 [Ensete ventricosum]|nr:hypothetical protein GW17_00004502 [Ensete ventricosum]RWW74087.1 hypothetical protein BHE74_00017990 [Ensete ventricosum]RZS10469.1 hypothetical protein BHM03_00041707 [Ensete ventricosum]
MLCNPPRYVDYIQERQECSIAVLVKCEDGSSSREELLSLQVQPDEDEVGCHGVSVFAYTPELQEGPGRDPRQYLHEEVR